MEHELYCRILHQAIKRCKNELYKRQPPFFRSEELTELDKIVNDLQDKDQVVLFPDISAFIIRRVKL